MKEEILSIETAQKLANYDKLEAKCTMLESDNLLLKQNIKEKNKTIEMLKKELKEKNTASTNMEGMF